MYNYKLSHDNNKPAVDCPLPSGDVPDGVNVLREGAERIIVKTKDDKLEVFHPSAFDLLPDVPGGRFPTPRIHNSSSGSVTDVHSKIWGRC